MAATFNSTFSQNLSVAQPGGSEGEETSVDTTSQTLDVSTGASSSEEEDMALQLGVDATAVGEDTLAIAEVEASVAGDDAVQSAYGSASLYASGSGEGAYASTSGYADIFGDADYSLSITYTSESVEQDGDYVQWEAAFVTEVFALDIDGVPVGTGEPSATISDPLDTGGAAVPGTEDEPDGDECGCWSEEPGGWEVDGNLVLFDVTVEAVGDDSFVQADVSALTVEDQLSTVTVVVTGAVG